MQSQNIPSGAEPSENDLRSSSGDPPVSDLTIQEVDDQVDQTPEFDIAIEHLCTEWAEVARSILSRRDTGSQQ